MDLLRICKNWTTALVAAIGLFFLVVLLALPFSNLIQEQSSLLSCLAIVLFSLLFFLKERIWMRALSGLLALVAVMGAVGALVLKLHGHESEQLFSLSAMSYFSIITLLLVGCAVIFQNTSRLLFMGQTFFFLGFCLSFCVLMAFFEGLYFHHFIGKTPYTTALLSVGWLLLSCCYLLGTPEQGMAGLLFNPSFSGQVFRRLLPAAFLIPILLSWLLMVGRVEWGLSLPLETELIGLATLLLFALVIWSTCYKTGKADFIVHDITKIQRHINLLEKRKKELENKSQELERTNVELEQFTISVSHDLQEPLRKIKNYGKLIQEKQGDLDPEVVHYVDRMVGGAERMHAFIASLLELAIMSKKEMRKEWVDLNQILAQVLEDLEVLISRSHAYVKVDLLPTIKADPDQMRSLFHNLISNAIKYHKKETPPIIAIESESLNEVTRITVQDNGIGIPSSYKKQIFHPFFRIDKNDLSSGTGVGLSICKRIIERHQGEIYAESSEGLGTIIIIELPAQQQAEKERAPQ